MSLFEPMLTDELLAKYSHEKQVALLKIERNMLVAMINAGSTPFSMPIKAGIMAQAVYQMKLLIHAKDSE